MGIVIEQPQGADALTEFVTFADKVYEDRAAHWPALVPMQLPFLLGQSAGAIGRKTHPLVARDGGEIVARACPIVDDHYIGHWKEQLGHIVLFEALPGSREAVRQLIDAASEWLRNAGMQAARAGFGGGLLDTPFVLDEYDALPPMIVRQNPIYYHSLLKDAGFESEQGWVDYKIEVTPDLVSRYESALEAVKLNGYEVVPLKDVPSDRVVGEFTDTFNTAFVKHWGFAPLTTEEVTEMIEMFGAMGALDTSLLAYKEGVPAGALFVLPPLTEMAATAPGRDIRGDEKLNVLGIGVLPEHRGKGVNMAMASYAYLELIKRGVSHLSYTLVLDDNWPSRRTGEKLGATVCANYMVYRRNFGRR
jgi:GNAT superfamily N-acetyltransferase